MWKKINYVMLCYVIRLCLRLRADYAKWTDVNITTRPGHACSIPLFGVSMQPIEHRMTCYRPCKSFGLCFVTVSHMSSILIRYFNNRLPQKVFVMIKN